MLNPGDPAPTVSLSDQHGNTVSLTEFLHRKVSLKDTPVRLLEALSS
jgi:peroxiredoxin